MTCLTDVALSEIFEVNAVKEKLAEDETEMKKILEACVQQEQEFLKSSTVFSHPVQQKSSADDDEKDAPATSTFGNVGKNGPPPSILV